MENNIYFVRIKQSDKAFEDWLCVVSGCNYGFAALQGCSLYENTFKDKPPVAGLSVDFVPEKDYQKMREAVENCGFHTTNDAKRILEVHAARAEETMVMEIVTIKDPLLPYVLAPGYQVIAVKKPGSFEYFVEVQTVGSGKTSLSLEYMRELGYQLRRLS